MKSPVANLVGLLVGKLVGQKRRDHGTKCAFVQTEQDKRGMSGVFGNTDGGHNIAVPCLTLHSDVLWSSVRAILCNVALKWGWGCQRPHDTMKTRTVPCPMLTAVAAHTRQGLAGNLGVCVGVLLHNGQTKKQKGTMR